MHFRTDKLSNNTLRCPNIWSRRKSDFHLTQRLFAFSISLAQTSIPPPKKKTTIFKQNSTEENNNNNKANDKKNQKNKQHQQTTATSCALTNQSNKNNTCNMFLNTHDIDCAHVLKNQIKPQNIETCKLSALLHNPKQPKQPKQPAAIESNIQTNTIFSTNNKKHNPNQQRNTRGHVPNHKQNKQIFCKCNTKCQNPHHQTGLPCEDTITLKPSMPQKPCNMLLNTHYVLCANAIKKQLIDHKQNFKTIYHRSTKHEKCSRAETNTKSLRQL